MNHLYTEGTRDIDESGSYTMSTCKVVEEMGIMIIDV